VLLKTTLTDADQNHAILNVRRICRFFIGRSIAMASCARIARIFDPTWFANIIVRFCLVTVSWIIRHYQTHHSSLFPLFFIQAAFTAAAMVYSGPTGSA
jgi:uncharacterized membrane protein